MRPVARSRAVSRVTAMVRRAGRTEHAKMLDAAAQVACGDEAKAMSLLESAVAAAPPGPFGWTLPIDPVFAALRDRPELARVFAAIASRAA